MVLHEEVLDGVQAVEINEIAFRGMVIGAATMGLTALVLTDALTDKPDRLSLMFARVLLGIVAVR
eukprot:3883107-Pyramimonas_sp.AAC.1